jgi:hypothetical protein
MDSVQQGNGGEQERPKRDHVPELPGGMEVCNGA